MSHAANMPVDPHELRSCADKCAEAADREIARLQTRVRWNSAEQSVLQEPLDKFRRYVEENALGKPGEQIPRLVTDGLHAWYTYVTAGPRAAVAAVGTLVAAKAAGAAAKIDPLGGGEWRVKNTELAQRLATQLRVQKQALEIVSDDVLESMNSSKAGDGPGVGELSVGMSMLAEVIEDTNELVRLSKRFLGIWTPLDAMRGDTGANEWLENKLGK